MSKLTEDDRTRMVRENVSSIYRALLRSSAPIGPEELASQYYSCLLAAAGLRLRAAGYRPWTPGGDEMGGEMVGAAKDAMEAALDRVLAARN
jgi:hypothetical protein